MLRLTGCLVLLLALPSTGTAEPGPFPAAPNPPPEVADPPRPTKWTPEKKTAPAPKPKVSAAPDDRAAADGALLVAGRPLPAGSSLRRFTGTANYRQYARKMEWTWNWFEKRTLAPIRDWVAANLPGPHPSTVFYPFSGPDILNAVTFYPDADTYLLYGLEKIGRLPGHMSGTSPAEFADHMANLRESLDHIIGLNFFRTASMRVEVGTDAHNGVAALMAFFLTRTGHTVTGARYIKLDDAGVPRNTRGGKWVRGIELTFRHADDPPERRRTAYYFRGDISDHAWSKATGMQAFVARQGPMATLLKAASYLMYEPAFDDIRATVLARSAIIIEESSGVPFHHLTRGPVAWDIDLYGVHRGPVEVFEGKCQPDLKQALETDSKGKLPFSFGYNHHPGLSHMIVARRRADQPITVPEFDGSPVHGLRTHCDSKGTQTVERK